MLQKTNYNTVRKAKSNGRIRCFLCGVAMAGAVTFYLSPAKTVETLCDTNAQVESQVGFTLDELRSMNLALLRLKGGYHPELSPPPRKPILND